MVYLLVITLFTTYSLLDTFVLPKVYKTVIDDEDSTLNPGEITIEENYYKDDNLEITITKDTYLGSNIYVCDLKINDLSLFKTAFAQNTYGKNIVQTVSEMAEEHEAIIAINGDYYGARETGYVIRKGVLYRDKKNNYQTDLVINKDGNWRFIEEKELAAQTLLDQGAWEVFSFGPVLIDDSRIVYDPQDNTGQGVTENPRTVIAYYDLHHYAFVLCDGRSSTNPGLTLEEMAAYLENLKVTKAYNLDGGGSTTLIFNDQLINLPTTDADIIQERKVSDIIYLGY